MSRDVPRRGGGRGRVGSILLLVSLAVVAGAFALPAGAFTTGEVPRGTNVGITADENAIVELDKATTVQQNSIDPLVNVTNNFETTRAFQISLVENDGDLYYNGQNVGKSVTITLLPGATANVSVEATGQPNTALEYDVSDTLASGTTKTRFDMRRSADIQPGNGGGPGNGNGGGNGTSNCPGTNSSC